MRNTTPSSGHSFIAAAIAALRVATGGLVAVRGIRRLVGGFGGEGLTAAVRSMGALGFRPAVPHALGAGLGEAVAGSALMAGLVTPAAGAVAAIARGVSASVRATDDAFAPDHGTTPAALLGLSALAFAVAGPGQVSLDAASGHVLDRPWMRGAAAALVPTVIAVELRRRARLLAL